MASYSMTTTLRAPFEEAKQQVTQALKEQGFGILTEIDVQKTLQEKIEVEFERYEILGACNPQLAHQALTTDRSIGLLLPCNVVLREIDDRVEVSMLDPEAMFQVADEQVRQQLADLAREARERLGRALEMLE